MFNFKKSKLALATSFLLAAGLSGCGSNQTQSNSAEEDGGLVSMKEDKDQRNRGADQSAVYNVSGDNSGNSQGQNQQATTSGTRDNRSMSERPGMADDPMASTSGMGNDRTTSADDSMQNQQNMAADMNQSSPISQTITFELNSAELTEEAKTTLRNALEETGQTPMEAEIVGYTDNTGEEDYNQTLSEQRAESVREFIAGLDANIDEWEVEGRGEQSPTSSNDSEWGRAQNRRVSVDLRPMEQQQAQQSDF